MKQKVTILADVGELRFAELHVYQLEPYFGKIGETRVVPKNKIEQAIALLKEEYDIEDVVVFAENPADTEKYEKMFK